MKYFHGKLFQIIWKASKKIQLNKFHFREQRYPIIESSCALLEISLSQIFIRVLFIDSSGNGRNRNLCIKLFEKGIRIICNEEMINKKRKINIKFLEFKLPILIFYWKFKTHPLKTENLEFKVTSDLIPFSEVLISPKLSYAHPLESRK